VRDDAAWLLDQQEAVLARIGALSSRGFRALRIRIHGDYHLGQLLYTGPDFVIIDFDGEPARSLGERRIKRSPLRDVAGMLRSFHYATHSALSEHISKFARPDGIAGLAPWARLWQAWVSAAFLGGYLSTAGIERLVPQQEDGLQTLLDAFLLDKALYEISYELNNRPDWVYIPLHGIIQLVRGE
ncbi:MAG: alpha-amylase, partial [Gemmatimonadetes bacterium]|nr:alpha-amylase [Gemmatimonadota bacterium]